MGVLVGVWTSLLSFFVVGLLVENRGSPPGALPTWTWTVVLGSGSALARAPSCNASLPVPPSRLG